MAKTLQAWLSWMEQQHPDSIALGLDRIKMVANKMALLPIKSKTIVVAGTNGKGSTVKAIEQIALAHGLTVACYTSPHINSYNERVCLNAQPCSDQALVQAIAMVHEAMGEIALTYFEIGTLACLLLMQQWQPDLCVLEVGLGGRLDAVNIVDADVAVITTVAMDHQDWLGDSIEMIAKEKAGVIRAEQPVILGDSNMPDAVLQQCQLMNACVIQTGQHFHSKLEDATWSLTSVANEWQQLTIPAIDIDCAANAVMALQQIACQIEQSKLNQALSDLKLSGRFECLSQSPDIYIDVAHNPQAVSRVANKIKAHAVKGKTYCIVGMLRDKAISGTLASLKTLVDEWHAISIDETPRGLDAQALAAHLHEDCKVLTHEHVTAALQHLMPQLQDEDFVIILGSFYTVAQANQAMLEIGN